MKIYTGFIFAALLLLVGMLCISLYSNRQMILQEQPEAPFVTELNAAEHPSAYIQKSGEPEADYEETSRQEALASENLLVYEIEGLINDTDFFWGYEVVSPDTGEVLKRLPYLSWCWLMDDDTLLWEEDSPVENHTWLRMLHADGTQALWDANFGILSQDERGRFLIEQHADSSDRDADEQTKGGRWYYGMLDRDLKTVLLPLQYSEMNNGGQKGRRTPVFWGGYIILDKGGKYGLLDYDLKERLPFSYADLREYSAQVYRYAKAREEGVLFLESGIECKDIRYRANGIRTIIVRTRDQKYDQLIDRSGKMLYQVPCGGGDVLSYDENLHPLLNGKPLEIPELTSQSSWAVQTIHSAETAGLVPAELKQLYQSPATRRNFCMLAIQLVRTLQPGLLEEASQKLIFLDCGNIESVNLAAQLGILTEESEYFEPYRIITRRDAADILAHTAQLLGMEDNLCQDEAAVFYQWNSEREDPTDSRTIERSIDAFWQLYQETTS